MRGQNLLLESFHNSNNKELANAIVWISFLNLECSKFNSNGTVSRGVPFRRWWTRKSSLCSPVHVNAMVLGWHLSSGKWIGTKMSSTPFSLMCRSAVWLFCLQSGGHAAWWFSRYAHSTMDLLAARSSRNKSLVSHPFFGFRHSLKATERELHGNKHHLRVCQRRKQMHLCNSTGLAPLAASQECVRTHTHCQARKSFLALSRFSVKHHPLLQSGLPWCW